MEAAISQVCTLKSSFADDLAEYASGACRTVELWFGKLEQYLEGHSVDEAAALLRQHALQAPVASMQGGLLSARDDALRAHLDHFRRRLDWAGPLGIKTIVLLGDFAAATGPQELSLATDRLRRIADLASEASVRLALEFQARAPFVNNLETAASLIASVNHPSLGICLDLFHYHVGPSKHDDLLLLTDENLFHVQFCDVAGVPREWATDADRILPGEGDFHLEPVTDRLRTIGYSGVVSLELMNPRLWNIPPRQFSEVGITALRKALGLASMGDTP